MKRILTRLVALVLVVVLSVGLGGCASDASGLTGNYRQDTLSLVESLRTAITAPDDSPNKKEL